jgi:hypothetical protein
VGDCLEACRQGSIVLVQDSKNPGVYQAWSQREWGELLGDIKIDFARPNGVYVPGNGCVELGLDRHDDKLSFTAAEWRAFEEDVIDDRFEFDKLREFGELSEGVSAGPGSVAGSGEAATGAVDGSGHCSDGPGSPVPVAAPYTYAALFPEGPPAGRPVDASTDEVTLSSAVQPGSDAAGTGVPPDPVPVAPYGDRRVLDFLDEALNVFRRALPDEDGLYGAARAVAHWAYEAGWKDHEAWATAVAPLVPAVETPELDGPCCEVARVTAGKQHEAACVGGTL